MKEKAMSTSRFTNSASPKIEMLFVDADETIEIIVYARVYFTRGCL